MQDYKNNKLIIKGIPPRSFYGFFRQMPSSVFETPRSEWGFTKKIGTNIINVTKKGQVRINPGLPKLFSNNLNFENRNFLISKLYNTLFKLKGIDKLNLKKSNSIFKSLKKDLSFYINSLQKKLPLSTKFLNDFKTTINSPNIRQFQNRINNLINKFYLTY